MMMIFACLQDSHFTPSRADFASDVASLFSSQDQVNSVVNALPTIEETEAAIDLAQVTRQQQRRTPQRQQHR